MNIKSASEFCILVYRRKCFPGKFYEIHDKEEEKMKGK
jgi:hypothetical protein